MTDTITGAAAAATATASAAGAQAATPTASAAATPAASAQDTATGTPPAHGLIAEIEAEIHTIERRIVAVPEGALSRLKSLVADLRKHL